MHLPIILFGKPSEVQQFVWFVIDFVVYVTLALLAVAYLKRRYLCDHCGHRWREPHPQSYSTLNEAHTGASRPRD